MKSLFTQYASATRMYQRLNNLRVSPYAELRLGWRAMSREPRIRIRELRNGNEIRETLPSCKAASETRARKRLANMLDREDFGEFTRRAIIINTERKE